MKNQRKLFKEIYKIIPTMLIVFVFYAAINPNAAHGLTKNPSETKTSNQNDFDKKFREARDLIDKEDWAQAAEKFKELIGKYPINKSTDAALYWLAFSYKKQKNFKEANAALDRLLKEFPDSSWNDDARVMKMEFMTSPGFALPINNYEGYFTKIITGNNASAFTLKSGSPFIELPAAKIPLDREDEIKLAAFQSLLSADAKRAIEILGDIIKPDSKASESLKQHVLRTLRNSYRTNSQLTEQLRQTLINNLQKQQKGKIKTEIIYTLGGINDEESINYLAEFYASENDLETKKAVINALGSSPSGFFYAYNTNGANLLNSTSKTSRKVEFDSLLEIIRLEKNTELRNLAISKLGRFGNLSDSVQMANTFSQLYDSETDEDLKLSIIRTLGNIKQNQASQKLLNIAKNEKSDKLKLEAIRSLRTSRDPEVLKFLEQLIN